MYRRKKSAKLDRVLDSLKNARFSKRLSMLVTDSETFNQKVRKTLDDQKHTKSLLIAESTTVMNNFMIKQSFLQILQYNIRKSLRIQESFLINKEVREFDIVVIQKQDCNNNNSQSFSSAHNFFHLVKNLSSQSRTCIYVNKYLKFNQ